ncbi:hypothetical protein BWI93_17460 [Siphonobacter sp. BAB-5385]|nr:hypothetical protein BWI93_17460 [Siphonobacter sp. BAB-5385]
MLGLLTSCDLSLFEPTDYPPSPTKLNGPKARTLASKPIALKEIDTLSLTGTRALIITPYALMLSDSVTYALRRFPQSTQPAKQPLEALFSDDAGTIWAIDMDATVGYSLHRYTGGAWVKEGNLPFDVKLYLNEVVKATAEEHWFRTNKGLVIWDVKEQKGHLVEETSERLFTKNFSLKSDNQQLQIYSNTNLSQPVAEYDLSQFLYTRKGIKNSLFGVFEDANRTLWLVVKDGRWDGVLMKFNGQTLEKLALIPVSNYDSGRSVTDFVLDAKGNLWMNVDGVPYYYSTYGQWIYPQMEQSLRIFNDTEGNLVGIKPGKVYRLEI